MELAAATYLSCAAILLGVTLILSCHRALRHKLRYDYREEWRRFSLLLFAEDSRQISRRVIKALADIVESPQGVLFEWEEKVGFVLKDCWNSSFPNRDVVIAPCFFTEYLQDCQRATKITSKWLPQREHVALPTAFAEFPWTWLVVPLLHGNRLHAFVLLAPPRISFFNINREVLDLLSMAGRQAVICLVQEQNAQALAAARQFEGYHRLSAFMMHDLKNVSAQLRLIESNRLKHASNPAFIKSVFETVENIAEKIDRLRLQMRDRQYDFNQGVAVHQAMQKVIHLTDHRQPVPKLDWQIIADEMIVQGDEEQFINVLCHLVENAQQATPTNGEIILTARLKEDSLLIEIQDTGFGMEYEFIHTGLYKPFVSTKGDKGMGIGVYEAREYMHAVGGRLTVETFKEKGTTFNLELPLFSRLAHAQLI